MIIVEKRKLCESFYWALRNAQFRAKIMRNFLLGLKEPEICAKMRRNFSKFSTAYTWREALDRGTCPGKCCGPMGFLFFNSLFFFFALFLSFFLSLSFSLSFPFSLFFSLLYPFCSLGLYLRYTFVANPVRVRSLQLRYTFVANLIRVPGHEFAPAVHFCG